ncbi:hypothetical protein Gasu2_50440 [Galdieria sulphuraria]|nr:hypothetical protein Gasu2_50440 [Galdieria sulphuraria]
MGSFEEIFGAWTEDWELESYRFATESKEPSFTEVPFEDLGKLKWSGNCIHAFEGQTSPWWRQNGSNCPFSLSSEANRQDTLEISSSVSHSCSDESPNVPLVTSKEQDDHFEQVFRDSLIQYDDPTWDPPWEDNSYHSVMMTLSEDGDYVPKEPSLHCPGRRRKRQLETFPLEHLKDLKGSTSAEGRKMTAEERALMLYKRKLRNRNSAARSRRRRTIILNEIIDQVSSLKTLIKQLQCRLCLYEGKGCLSKVDARFEEVAVLRAKLMGTKVKGNFTIEKQQWENTTERSFSFTSV